MHAPTYINETFTGEVAFGLTSLTLILMLLHVLLVCCMGHLLPCSRLLAFKNLWKVDIWYQKSTFDRTQGLAFRFINFNSCVLCPPK